MKTLLMSMLLVLCVCVACDPEAIKTERTGPAVDGMVPVTVTFEDGSTLNTTVPDKTGVIEIPIPGGGTVAITLDGSAATDGGEMSTLDVVLGTGMKLLEGGSGPLWIVLAGQALRVLGAGAKKKVLPVAGPAPAAPAT